MKPTRPTLIKLATASALALVASSSLRAASGSWNVDAASSWGTASNWTPAAVPGSAIGDVINFTNNITVARTITLDGNRTMGDLNIGDSTTGFFGYTIATGATTTNVIIMDVASGSASIDFTNTGTNGAANTISTGITLNDNLVIRSNNTLVQTLSGVINDGASSYSLTFNNDVNGTSAASATNQGQIALSGANTYDGGTTINDVRVATAANAAFGTGAITVTGAGQVYFSGGTRTNALTLNSTGWVETAGNLGALRIENATISGNVTIQQNTRIGNNANNVGTISGAIIGAFDITKVAGTATGPQGVLLLSGNNTTWSGNLIVEKGTVRVSTNVNALGTGSSILVDGAAAAVAGGSALDLNGAFTWGTGKTLTLKTSAATSGDFRASLLNSSGVSTWAGNIVLDSAVPNGVLVQINSTGTLTLNGTITGTGTNYPDLLFLRGSSTTSVVGSTCVINAPNTDFGKTDAGTWTINSTGNSWDSTLVADGTIKLGVNDALDTTAPLVLGQGSATTGQLDLNGFNQTVDSLHSDLRSSSAGLIIKNGGATASTLTFTNNTADTVTLGGQNQDASAFKGTLSGNVSLVKNGTGTFTLNSTTPSVVVPAWTTGSVTVNQGGLNLTGSVALGDATTSVVMADGTTLSGEGTIGGNLVMGTTTGTTLVVDGSTTGALSVNTATFNAPVALSFPSPLSSTGTTRLLNVTATPGGLGLGAFTVPSGIRSGTVTFTSTGTPGVDLTYSVASLTWNGPTGSTWDIGTSATWTDTVPATSTFFNGDSVTLGDAPAANQSINLVGSLSPALLTFDSTYQYTLGGSGTLNTAIVKNNTGTLVLDVDSVSGAAATVNAGTLQIGNGGTTGSITSSIVNSSNVVFNYGAGANVSYAGVISGTGTLTKSGAGTLVLPSGVAQSFTGSTTVTEGTLRVNQIVSGTATAGGLSGTSAVTVSGTGTLALYGPNVDLTFAKPISGDGTVSFDLNNGGAAGSRSLTLSGANSGFTGTLVLQPSGNYSTNGTFRTAGATAQANLGSAAVVVGNGAQLWVTGNVTNNLSLSGAGYQEPSGGVVASSAMGADGNPITVPSLAYGGIGAVRMDGSTLSGNITISGDTKLTPFTVTGTLSGTITKTNSGDTFVFGGTNSGTGSTLNLTGDASGLGRIWVNGGSTGTGAQTLVIGNNTTTGSLGSGDVILYQDTAAAILVFQRSDGYALPAGQNIMTAHNGTASNLSKVVLRVNTTGTGLTVGGSGANLIDLSDGTNGGNINVGQNIAGSVLNVASGATIQTRYFGVGEQANFSSTVNQTGGSVTISGANTDTNNNLRVGHWPTETSTYNLSGGSINFTAVTPANPSNTAETAGGLYVGIDGQGIFNQSGGTISTNYVVLDNRGNSAAGTNMATGVDQFNLSGGLLQLKSLYGIIGRNTSTEINLSGGTIENAAGDTIDVAINAVANTVAATTTTLDTVNATRKFSLMNDITGTGTLALVNGGTIELEPDSNATRNGVSSGAGIQTIAAALSGSNPLSKIGTGTTTLSGNNSAFTGAVSVSAGRLNLSAANGSAVTVADGATVGGEGTVPSLTLGSSSGANLAIDGSTSGALTTTNLTVTGVTSISLDASPSDGNPVTVLNFTNNVSGATAANFVLSSSGNFRSSTISVNASSVTLNPGTVAQTWTGETSGVWDVGVTDNWSDVSGKFFWGDSVTFDDSGSAANTAVTLTGAIQPALLTVNSSTNNYTFTASSGNVLSGGGSLIKRGSSVLTMAGNVANTFTGGSTLSQGTINLQNVASLGTGAITVGDLSSGSANAALYLDANRPAASTYVTNVAVTSNGTGSVTLGSRATVVGTGAMGFNGIVLARDVVFDSNANDRTDYNTISGTGNITVTGLGRTLFMTANTFVGNINISLGSSSNATFQIGTNTAGNQNYIPDATSLTVNDTPGNALAEFRVSVGGETIAGLSGNGTIDANAINGVLTVGNGDVSSTFSGQIINGGANTVGLTKIGTGTLTLTGANTTTGATTVSAGSLVIGDGATSGSIGGALAVASGATATVDRSDASSLPAALSGAGTLNKNGVGILTLGAGGSFTGTLNLNGGSLVFGATNPTATGVTAAAFNLAAGTILTNGGASTHGHIGALTMAGGSTWTTDNGTGTYDTENYQLNGDVTVSGGSVAALITRDASRTDVNSGISLRGSRTFTVADVTSSSASDLVVSTELEDTDAATITAAGVSSLVKAGAGTLELVNANSYTGGTTISAGAVKLGNVASLGTGAASVASGATLDLGGNIIANVVTFAAGSNLVGSGTVPAAGGTVAGNVAPGNSAGTVHFANTSVALSGTCSLEIGGTAAGTYDVIGANGAISVSGTVNVTLINGFTPAAGNSWDLFNDDGAFTSTATLNLPTLPAGLGWDTSTFATTGVVSVVTTGPTLGAFNSSNFTLAEQGNAAISGPTADPDGDGVSNVLEYAFASNPKAASRANLPVSNTTVSSGSTYVGCVYTRVKGATDLAFTVQFSSTPDSSGFADAVAGVDYTLVSTVDNGNGTETITIRDNTAVSPSVKRFVRILVTYP